MLCTVLARRQLGDTKAGALVRRLVKARRIWVRTLFRAWKRRYELRLFDAMLQTGHATLTMDLDALMEETSRAGR